MVGLGDLKEITRLTGEAISVINVFYVVLDVRLGQAYFIKNSIIKQKSCIL